LICLNVGSFPENQNEYSAGDSGGPRSLWSQVPAQHIAGLLKTCVVPIVIRHSGEVEKTSSQEGSFSHANTNENPTLIARDAMEALQGLA